MYKSVFEKKKCSNLSLVFFWHRKDAVFFSMNIYSNPFFWHSWDVVASLPTISFG